MRLYHGSDGAIERPEVSLNTGFSDLGRGFYLTDDADVAANRARSRARRTGGSAVVSVYAFDESGMSWISATACGAQTHSEASADAAATPRQEPFGLRFPADKDGIARWMDYIRSCREGTTAVRGVGEPSIVRAWIATEEVEMACSGLIDASEIAEFVDPGSLTVQYCFRDQGFLEEHLLFVEALAV